MPEKITKKRKRESKNVSEDAESGLDAMEIFKRHFESQFAPLKTGVKNVKKEVKVEVEDEWEGLSNEGDSEDETREPEVIEFNTSKDPLAADIKLPKSILKSFMSSKPPSIHPPTSKTKTKGRKKTISDNSDSEDPTTEASLLKNDLALQRLLRESHLLDASSSTLEATGKNRLKALESRVQSLGGKDITKQKMPMAARKGIDATRRMREEKRRKHAKEAGIVLEKEVRVKKLTSREKVRDRGFGPSVGRFKNGTLVLSKRDVMDIEGRTGGGSSMGKKERGPKAKGGKKRRQKKVEMIPEMILVVIQLLETTSTPKQLPNLQKTLQMSKDSSRTYIHLPSGRIADLFEDFCRDKLPNDDVYVPPHHQPINPEDEDDVIPDQHAAFGIAQAQQKKHEPAWKDLGLNELMTAGPKPTEKAPRRLPR